MDLNMSHLGNLVPEGPSCVFTGSDTKFSLLLYTDLISNKQTNKQTNRYTAHKGANRMTHPHKYILTPLAMCLQQLSVLNE